MGGCFSSRRQSRRRNRNESLKRNRSRSSRNPDDDKVIVEPEITGSGDHLSSTLEAMVNSIREGLDSGYNPMRSEEGTGGVYFMPDRTGTQFVGVFKPMDEEPFALNSRWCQDVSTTWNGLKSGTIAGEGAYREVAAYILDHPIRGPRSNWDGDNEPGFAGVPPTILIRCFHGAFRNSSGMKNTKMGSLQVFVKNHGTCQHMGTDRFPVEQVHAISVLDLRLANADRHAGNILFCNEGSSSSIRLVPIDHGYCLPETFEDCMFEWMSWPQAKKPYSPEILKYIQSLDAEKDIKLLERRGLQISDNSLRVLRIATMLLKKTAAAGFTPFMIAQIISKEEDDKPSDIEDMIKEAEEAISPFFSENFFFNALYKRMDRYIANKMRWGTR